MFFSKKYKQNYSFFLNTKFIRRQERTYQRNKAILFIVLRVKTVKLTGLAFVEFVFVSKSFGQNTGGPTKSCVINMDKTY